MNTTAAFGSPFLIVLLVLVWPETGLGTDSKYVFPKGPETTLIRSTGNFLKLLECPALGSSLGDCGPGAIGPILPFTALYIVSPLIHLNLSSMACGYT
jgi:hypothetical protein